MMHRVKINLLFPYETFYHLESVSAMKIEKAPLIIIIINWDWWINVYFFVMLAL